METHGPLGILWVGLGLGCFYVALIWLNTLLGTFLTPLFLIPATWLQDAVMKRRRERAVEPDATAARTTRAATTTTTTTTTTRD